MNKNNKLYSLFVTLLKPSIRLMLRGGIKYQEMEEVFKHSLIEIAKEELSKKQSKVNTSRLSATTGLQRKDIKRLNEQEIYYPKANLLSKIIGKWFSGSDYTLNDGTPKKLTTSQFSALVNSVASDLNAGTVKFELIRAGVIEEGEDNKLVLKSALLDIHSESYEKIIESVSLDIDQLTLAVEENVFSRNNVPNLHVSTRFDNITKERVDEIRKWCLKEGSILHRKALEKFSSYDKDMNPSLYDKEGGTQIVLSSFSYIETTKKDDNEK